MIFFDLFRREPDLLEVAAGAFVFKEGESEDFMYVVVSGSANVMIGDRVVENCTVGTVLGETAMIGNDSRCTSVVALTNCEIARIDRKRFHFLISQTPSFATEVMKIMARRLRNADGMLREQGGN